MTASSTLATSCFVIHFPVVNGERGKKYMLVFRIDERMGLVFAVGMKRNRDAIRHLIGKPNHRIGRDLATPPRFCNWRFDIEHSGPAPDHPNSVSRAGVEITLVKIRLLNLL